MSYQEEQTFLNKDLQKLGGAKHFLSNYYYFSKKATHQYEKDDLVREKRHHMKALIRIGLENMP